MLDIKARVIAEAKLMIETSLTLRAIAKKFGVSRTTVHKDLTIRLKEIDSDLHLKVNNIIQVNKQERSTRGGNAKASKRKSKPAGLEVLT